jgi:cyclopropane fatty-acyl-phospholipid synthase-like methyltransferase
MSQMYADAIDRRFAPIVDEVIKRATLHPGEQVLDLGTGTGEAAIKAASLVGASGRVVGVDISPKMLTQARQRVEGLGLGVPRRSRAPMAPSTPCWRHSV